MAKCIIKIEFVSSAQNFIDKARSAITDARGTFEGDTKEGKFNLPTALGDIHGTYLIDGAMANITITQKPLFISCKSIEQKFLDYMNMPLVKAPEAKTTISKDVSLLVIGALISLFTAVTTNYIASRNEDKRVNTQKKIEFNEKLSKDLNKRLFYSYELFMNKRDLSDTTLKTNLALYKKSKEEWNINSAYYEAMLNFYYGTAIGQEFVNEILNPEIDLGKRAQYDTVYKKDFLDQYEQCRKRNIIFIQRLYDNM